MMQNSQRRIALSAMRTLLSTLIFLCFLAPSLLHRFTLSMAHARIEDKLGDVVLVLSRGRSGSGYLMRVIANVADCKNNASISGELFMQKYGAMENMKTPTKFLRAYFKDKRKKVGPSEMIGSKWKPYVDNVHFDKAWKYVAWIGWPVIYSHRNPLDVVISTAKHAAIPFQPHCTSGDSECLLKFHGLKVDIDIPAALQEVQSEAQQNDALRRKLQHFGVRFTELTYEQLTYGNDEARLRELQRVADFFLLAQQQQQRRIRRLVHMRDLDTDIVMTGSYNQSQYVRNYAALREAFEKTPYKHLLHP